MYTFFNVRVVQMSLEKTVILDIIISDSHAIHQTKEKISLVYKSIYFYVNCINY